MNEKKGWVRVYRSIEDNPIWTEEKFTKGQAWIDLIMMMNHKDDEIILNNEYVTIHAGQRWTSILKLSARWKWSTHKCRNYLKLLESGGMLTVQRTQSGILLELQNYQKYQGIAESQELPKEQQKNNKRKTKEQQRNNDLPTNKNDKEYIRMIKNEKEGNAEQGGWKGGYE